MIKRILPSEHVILETNLSKDQVFERLKNNIDPKKPMVYSRDSITKVSKKYNGVFDQSNFEISRTIKYRNSFLPIIKGTISDNHCKTKIDILMKPHSLIKAFATVWFIGISFACITITYSVFKSGFEPYVFIPYGMLFIGILLVFSSFKAESSKSKKDLMKILNAKVSQE